MECSAPELWHGGHVPLRLCRTFLCGVPIMLAPHLSTLSVTGIAMSYLPPEAALLSAEAATSVSAQQHLPCIQHS